jgi:5-methylcytosine-specific restriction endonuclease McrA
MSRKRQQQSANPGDVGETDDARSPIHTKQPRPISRAQRVLAVVAADNTFVKSLVRGELQWVGKCIHCNAKVLVTLAGATFATLEHIEPKNHGGSDAPENLAIACARCNSGKGMRLDHRARTDPTLPSVIEMLRARRLERLRSE